MLSQRFKLIAISLAATASLSAAELVEGEGAAIPPQEWVAALGVDAAQANNSFSTNGTLSAQLIGAAERTNILWPGEQPDLEIQLQNLGDTAIATTVRILVVSFETWTHDGEIFQYGVTGLGEVSRSELSIAVPAKGAQRLRITPQIPERKGGYAVLLEPGDQQPRLFLTSVARTFKPAFTKRQFYKLTMDLSDPGVLRRLGAAPNRIGFSPQPPSRGAKAIEEHYQQWSKRLQEYADAGLPIAIEFGHGAPFHGEMAPLGRNRPPLDDKGVMQDGSGDIVWLPEYDGYFADFVKRVLIDHGWPKGAVNAVKIWNEPWNGGSIAGWAADDERFREMTIAMDKGVRAARAEAGVEVLQGGADSSSNTLDKYFSDGTDRFDPMFDFLSIHYQGTDPHTNWRAWRERKGPDGKPDPVLIWDTESWVGNTDDRVASVLATMYSFGQQRAVGIQSQKTVARNFERTVLQPDGKPVLLPDGKKDEREIIHAFGPAAAVGAFQELVGEDRPFRELVWHGLPFVLHFDGKPAGGQPASEDGTLVVLGDMGFYNPDAVALRTVRSRAELDGKRALRAKLAAMPADAAERKPLEASLLKAWPYTGCSMTLKADGTRFGLLDFYGNPLPAVEGTITVPLNQRGYYLRGDGKPGSFAALLAALKMARIDGYEPLEKKIRDFTAPIASKPTLHIELRNVLNRPLSGPLSITIPGLELAYPAQVEFAAHERKVIEVAVTGGTANAANRYPLSFRYDGGNGLTSELDEEVRVNWISRRTIEVDGKLDDWKDALPQSIAIEEAATATITEKAWRPWETFDEGIKKGFSLGYLAWDDQNFYFAAKIADTTQHPGMLRFGTRNDDEFFYPEVSYVKAKPKREGESGGNFSARWSGFLQAAKTGKHTLILTTDDGVRAWLDGKQVINDWTDRGPTDSKVEVELTAGKRVPIRIEYFQGGGGCSARFDWIEPGGERTPVPAASLFTAAADGKTGLTAEFFPGTELVGKPKVTRIDAAIAYADWPTEPWIEPNKPTAEFDEMRWPEGVRRYSYRKEPMLPCGNGHGNYDNVQLAFNVLPEERKKKISVLPGLFQDYLSYSCTDYEWALNPVAEAYGGGTEVFRLRRPDMPHKHHYPRSLISPVDGPAKGAQLKIVYEGGWRIVEAAIPWSEVPEAKARLDAGETVKFSYRVNDNQGVGCMELSKRRSVAKRNSSFYADWGEHWANELEFGAERK